MNYEKKMIYLSYIDNEKRICNGGFVKLVRKGQKFNLDMQINLKNYPYEGKYDVSVSGAGRQTVLGKIYLDAGVGSFKREYAALAIKKGDQQFEYNNINEIKVIINEDIYLKGIVKEEPKPRKIDSEQFEKVIDGKEWQYQPLAEEKPEPDFSPVVRDEADVVVEAVVKDEVEPAVQSEAVVQSEAAVHSELVVQTEPAVQTEAVVYSEPTVYSDPAAQTNPAIQPILDMQPESASANMQSEPQPIDQYSSPVNQKASQAPKNDSESNPKATPFVQAYQEDVRQILHDMRMTPDKWQQLVKNYKQIYPYGDDRLYISLEPKDFVIMSSEYQHLAHNSFLLHGFYNYRHIILGRENNEFYLGVPGVFYEREKMVAMMFGFEAFECEGGKAENGKFGYYLKKVKL